MEISQAATIWAVCLILGSRPIALVNVIAAQYDFGQVTMEAMTSGGWINRLIFKKGQDPVRIAISMYLA